MTIPPQSPSLQRILSVGEEDVLAEIIVAGRSSVPADRAMLVAVSGIDGSGKGYLTARLVSRLVSHGVRAADVNIDGWLALPDVRFSTVDPGGNFYRHGLRLDEMFERLVLPLKRMRSLSIEADFAPPESMGTAYRRHRYEYHDVDVIVLDGIFLLKKQYRALHDLAIWVECSFETALERALARNQEGLPAADIVREYESIYFPAERLHFALDAPRDAADVIVVNDERLAERRLPGKWR